MTPGDLREWRHTLRMSQHEAASLLGLSLRWYQALEAGRDHGGREIAEIDRRTALACSALAHGLPEWR